MGEGKIEITVGQISFLGEGDQSWLSEQLDKVLDRAADLMKIAPPEAAASGEFQAAVQHGPASSVWDNVKKQPLGAFLRAKDATNNQNLKFLATAVWLHAKGQERLSTSDVTTALRRANQTKIGNPSDTLNRNVTKGCCEKDGKSFFVTPEGKETLGL